MGVPPPHRSALSPLNAKALMVKTSFFSVYTLNAKCRDKSWHRRRIYLEDKAKVVASRDVNDNTSSLIIKLQYRIVLIAKRNENV